MSILGSVLTSCLFDRLFLTGYLFKLGIYTLFWGIIEKKVNFLGKIVMVIHRLYLIGLTRLAGKGSG